MEWINCKKQLPKENKYYLTKWWDDSIHQMRFRKGKHPTWIFKYNKNSIFYGHSLITKCLSSRMKVLYWKPPSKLPKE